MTDDKNTPDDDRHLRLVTGSVPSGQEPPADRSDSQDDAPVVVAPVDEDIPESRGPDAADVDPPRRLGLRARLAELVQANRAREISGAELSDRCARLVLDHLEEHGEFLMLDAPTRIVYVANGGRQVIDVDERSTRWKAYLADVMDVTPGSCLRAAVAYSTMTARSRSRPILEARLGAWDGAHFLIPAAGGRVLQIGAERVDVVDNPCGRFLFVSGDDWALPPLEAAWPRDPTLRMLREVVTADWSFDSRSAATPIQQEALVIVWTLLPLLGDLVPTRPILLALGPKGSGKTTSLRMLGRLLLGDAFDVGEPGGALDFRAMTCSMPLVVLDNVDSPLPWLEDALCRVASGQMPAMKKMFTTNTLVRHRANAIVALSARTPRFRRPDVADRLLIIRFATRGTAQHLWASERVLRETLQMYRTEVWCDIVACLQRLAQRLDAGLPGVPVNTRFADFAQVGAALAESFGLRDEFVGGLRAMEQERARFATARDTDPRDEQDEALLTALVQWVEAEPGLAADGLPARELAPLLASMMGRPGDDLTPMSAVGLGRALSQLSRRTTPVILEARTLDGVTIWSARLAGSLVSG